MAGKPKRAAEITEEQLAEYTEVRAQKLELDRQSRALGKRQSALEGHFRGIMETLGKTSIKRLGYQLSLVAGRAVVRWKDAYVELAGPLKAAELQEAVEPPLKLQVEQI